LNSEFGGPETFKNRKKKKKNRRKVVKRIYLFFTLSWKYLLMKSSHFFCCCSWNCADDCCLEGPGSPTEKLGRVACIGMVGRLSQGSQNSLMTGFATDPDDSAA